MDDEWSGLAYLLSELILKYSPQIDFEKLREMDEKKNDKEKETLQIIESEQAIDKKYAAWYNIRDDNVQTHWRLHHGWYILNGEI